ncbi:MAG TPA: alkylhydroperoxidase, partial [Alcanivorax sp.]|nr:alkylhydroperoxidase [Alcanivorax sp.]HAI25118.1 alkylhydroperoxidase [Alcanivorax sp.]HAI36489.1 alkylhydroperoxidase [Alcanivorax sp.]HAI88138.1 alkylhydroperoxidase [Alcanivorax sp.]HAV68461.1 alkylhydroperoxidase [Alcanivorax sp.]
SREYDRLATHFTEKERTDLTYVIAMINVWNRFSVGFRREPE